MKKDMETWKCLGIGLVVWFVACVSVFASRVEFGLSVERHTDDPSTGVIISRVITETGEYVITEDFVNFLP